MDDQSIGDRYRVERMLGEGRTSQVFLAWDRKLNQSIALKILRSEASETTRQRFVREVRILRNIRHPNLVSGYDLVDDGDTLAAVMEYVPGEDMVEHLNHHSEQCSAMPKRLSPIADGLAVLHEAGIVHRDVKPMNIIIGAESQPVLVDFGTAWESGGHTRITRTGAIIGTPQYMSPEQCQGWTLGPSTDVYSLALVILEAVAGEHPFAELDLATSYEVRALPITQLDSPNIGESLRDILTHALSVNPEARPNASTFAKQLRHVAMPSGPVVSSDEPVREAAIALAPDGRWFQIAGYAPHDLTRRRALRLILLKLVEHHRDARGAAVSLDELIDAGWPGEKMVGDTGSSRAYVALSKLRKMGLRDLLKTRDDGYLLDPEAVIEMT